MFRYSICFIIGILLYILLNRRNGFSVGISQYRLKDKLTGELHVMAIFEDSMEVAKKKFEEMEIDLEKYNIIDVGDVLIDEPADTDSGASGDAGGGGGTASGKESIDKLMDSYKICNPSITDDILSQLRCAYDSNKVRGYINCDRKELRCHASAGIFQEPWFEEIYNITIGIFGPSNSNGWYEFGQYLNSGNHYLASLSLPKHSFSLEFKDKQFRILSSWEGVNGFLDFPSMSKWGNFNGHPDWNEFTRLMTILNGRSLPSSWLGSQIATSPSNDYTWTWTEEELRQSVEIYHELFSMPIDSIAAYMQIYFKEKKDKEPSWRKAGDEFLAYPKGKIVRELRVFIQINGLKEA